MEQARLLVLYATQTGNAQDVAERIGREGRRRHWRVAVRSTDAFSPPQLATETRIVFVVSTTGQGDPPDSLRHFWRMLLRKNLPRDCLAHLAVAVFGLGDSSYPKYNVTAKKLERRLVDLGAKPFVSLGLGDDQARGGFETALDRWLEQLWAAARAAQPLPPGLADPPPGPPQHLDPPRLVCELLAAAEAQPLPPPAPKCSEADLRECLGASALLDSALEASAGFHHWGAAEASEAQQHPRPDGDSAGRAPPAGPPGGSQANPLVAVLTRNDRATAPGHFQDVRHLEFAAKGGELPYAPGDSLAIRPLSRAEDAEALLRRIGVDPSAAVRVRPAEADAAGGPAAARWARPVRALSLIRGALDVASAAPGRYLFEVLAHFVTAEHEKERLEYFASSEGRDDLWRYCGGERRTLLEVLADFPSVQPPLAWLLQVAPRLRPRHYSVASSPREAPGSARLLVAVATWRTPMNRQRTGLCSGLLADASVGSHWAVWVAPGALRLPPDPSVPLVLVGPGTGVAPLRSLLKERALEAAAAGRPAGPALLFFGCRGRSADCFFADEWEELSRANGPLDAARGGGVAYAFSRDQPQKDYVQHAIGRSAGRVWALLQAGAVVAVAGSAKKMPADVAEAFRAVAKTEGGMGEGDAQAWMRQLEASRRYTVECWV